MKKGKKNNSIIYFISTFIIFIGLSIIIYNSYRGYKINQIEQVNITYFFDTKPKEVTKLNQKVKKEKLIKYIAVLEIPKINLKKGLVSPNSNLNNVNKNIQILTTSNMPDQKEKNLILAAHSGSSKVSFFKNINKLVLNDYIYVYYQNIKYYYKIIRKYEVEKTGKISIENKNKQTLLTLTTCSYKKNKQLIIIAKQIKNHKY